MKKELISVKELYIYTPEGQLILWVDLVSGKPETRRLDELVKEGYKITLLHEKEEIKNKLNKEILNNILHNIPAAYYYLLIKYIIS
ncbi:MAG: hypothetical protein ACP5H7_02635 [Minisyncoccia bacterium]